MFRFDKRCQSGKAVTLRLTSFATRPFLAVIKLEGRQLLLFPHILGAYYQTPLDFLKFINSLIICTICAFSIFFSKFLDFLQW